jgi:hypothetical protein
VQGKKSAGGAPGSSTRIADVVCDLVPRQAQLEQQRLGVLAVLGGPGRPAGSLVELDRRRHHRQRSAVTDVDRGEVAVGLHLRVVVQLAGRLHRRPLARELGERPPPPVEVPAGEDLVEPLDAGTGVPLPGVLVAEAGIGRDLGVADRPAEVVPVTIGGQHRQRHEPAVGRPVGQHQRVPRRVPVGRPWRRLVAVVERRAHDLGLELPHPRREQRGVDDRRLAARGPEVQRGADGPNGRKGADDVAERRWRPARPGGPGRGEGVLHPGAGPVRPRVIAPTVGVGATHPERGRPHVDDRRVVGPHVLDLDAEAAAGGGPEVRDEHVGRPHEACQDPATVGVLEIDAHRPLPAVRRLHVRVHAVLQRVEAARHQAPVGIAGVGVLDLDDVGTPLGEDGARHRSEDVRGDLDDPHAGERPGHRIVGRTFRRTRQVSTHISCRTCARTATSTSGRAGGGRR